VVGTSRSLGCFSLSSFLLLLRFKEALTSPEDWPAILFRLRSWFRLTASLLLQSWGEKLEGRNWLRGSPTVFPQACEGTNQSYLLFLHLLGARSLYRVKLFFPRLQRSMLSPRLPTIVHKNTVCPKRDWCQCSTVSASLLFILRGAG